MDYTVLPLPKTKDWEIINILRLLFPPSMALSELILVGYLRGIINENEYVLLRGFLNEKNIPLFSVEE